MPKTKQKTCYQYQVVLEDVKLNEVVNMSSQMLVGIFHGRISSGHLEERGCRLNWEQKWVMYLSCLFYSKHVQHFYFIQQRM